MLAAPDMALARLNAFSFWVLIPAQLLLFISRKTEGGAGPGWTYYPPLSSIQFHNTPAVDLGIFSLHVAGRGSLFSSINFITTLFVMRMKKNRIDRLEIFCWAMFITA